MSIKAIALELYKAQQKVHQLQDKLAESAPAEKDQLRYELKQAEVECNYLRRIVNAEKESSSLSRDTFKHY